MSAVQVVAVAIRRYAVIGIVTCTTPSIAARLTGAPDGL
jgi:hypothetical protein